MKVLLVLLSLLAVAYAGTTIGNPYVQLKSNHASTGLSSSYTLIASWQECGTTADTAMTLTFPSAFTVQAASAWACTATVNSVAITVTVTVSGQVVTFTSASYGTSTTNLAQITCTSGLIPATAGSVSFASGALVGVGTCITAATLSTINAAYIAQANTLTSSSSATGAKPTYTLSFYNTYQFASGDSIALTFPAAFTLPASSGITAATSCSFGATAATFSVSGQVLTITSAGTTVTQGTGVSCQFTGITSPTATGSYNVTIAGTMTALTTACTTGQTAVTGICASGTGTDTTFATITAGAASLSASLLLAMVALFVLVL